MPYAWMPSGNASCIHAAFLRLHDQRQTNHCSTKSFYFHSDGGLSVMWGNVIYSTGLVLNWVSLSPSLQFYFTLSISFFFPFWAIFDSLLVFENNFTVFKSDESAATGRRILEFIKLKISYPWCKHFGSINRQKTNKRQYAIQMRNIVEWKWHPIFAYCLE